jgi:hypothetical protein
MFSRGFTLNDADKIKNQQKQFGTLFRFAPIRVNPRLNLDSFAKMNL